MLENTVTLVKYRSAKQSPQELRDACKVFLEEGLLANALSLENELLTSPSDPDAPTFIQPPISHISFASTLLVHPKYTTQAKDDYRGLLPHALAYLRNLLAIMGPRNARLNEAFLFEQQSPRGGAYGRNGKGRRSIGSEETALEEINVPLATNGGVWAKAQDFWHVVGWTFNCSVVHRERWEYWKIWLEYMLDVMDADWRQREASDSEVWENQKKTQATAEEVFDARADSLICHYVSSQRGKAHIKRLIKSVFADGTDGSRKQFPEVFAKEAISPRRGSNRKKQDFGPVDLENGNFGAYGSSDDAEDVGDAGSDSKFPIPARGPGDGHTADDLSLTMGGHESMALRLRLMALLSRTSYQLPRDDAIPLRDLYFKFAESLHPMPLESFSLFISTSALQHFPPAFLSTLCQATLNGLIDDKAFEPTDYDLTVDSLITCFLPWAANTAATEDNAKLSLLIETLLRLYVREPDIKYASSLEDFAALEAAVEKGIRARDARVDEQKRKGKRSRAGPQAGDAGVWLRCSGERMRLLIPVYEGKLLRVRSDWESSQGSADRMEL